jgi:hypothetical protein
MMIYSIKRLNFVQMQIKMLFYSLGINTLTSFSKSPPFLKWGMNAKKFTDSVGVGTPAE